MGFVDRVGLGANGACGCDGIFPHIIHDLINDALIFFRGAFRGYHCSIILIHIAGGKGPRENSYDDKNG